MGFKKFKGGLIILKYCKCKKYNPKSVKGLVDMDCINCGGKRAEMIFK